MEQKSEVAQMRAQIATEYEAAQRGLVGYSVVGRHDVINKSMEALGESIERLEQVYGDRGAAVRAMCEIMEGGELPR